MNDLFRSVRAGLTAAAMLLLPALSPAVPTAVFAQGGGPQGPPIAITGASVLNVEDGSVIQNAVVLIEGDRIKAIGPAGSVQLPANVRKLPLDGKWLSR
jgi:imidazolonepropionase-like amidohydrolase